jgi:hypothetical protein
LGFPSIIVSSEFKFRHGGFVELVAWFQSYVPLLDPFFVPFFTFALCLGILLLLL